ncbi:MAG: Trk system potassium transporter TrkA [Ruminococcaceae bacterium]|nr:Trk system potassium transporter TrkA [Oscillospiraceae bacterium]
MNIIIIGCGEVGKTLAEQLNTADNRITVVDTRSEVIEELTARVDVMGIVGNGATLSVQNEAGVKHADLLIAVTESDELNLLCCAVAGKYPRCRTIARVRSPEYSAEAVYLKNEFDITMLINPEQAAATEITRILRFPSAIKIDTFARGRVELLKFRLPEDSILAGMSVKDAAIKLKCDMLFCTVERGDEVYIAKGNFVFAGKDVISLIASPKNASEFFKKIGYKIRSVKDIMIAGCGSMTDYLCAMLRKDGISVTVIEPDLIRGEELSIRHPEVKVLNGDPTDKSLLMEAGIARMGAFAALTPHDEENILLSLFAKSACQGKTITKINRIEFDEVISRLDLDSTVYPKHITAEIIARYVRATQNSMGSNMETLYHVIKDQVEAAEFVVREASPVTNTPLCELKINPDVLIGAIIHNGQVIIPRGNDRILPGDTVIIVSKQLALHDLTDILK